MRADQCFQGAVAFCLGRDLDDVFDMQLDRRLSLHPGWVVDQRVVEEINRQAWSDFEAWLAREGLEMCVHPAEELPLAGRWIAHFPVTALLTKVWGRPPLPEEMKDTRGFTDHCLAYDGAELVYEPSGSTEAQCWLFDLADVTVGYSFKKREAE